MTVKQQLIDAGLSVQQIKDMFGDLRKKEVRNAAEVWLSNPVTEPVPAASTEQTNCAVEPQQPKQQWNVSTKIVNNNTNVDTWLRVWRNTNKHQWLSCPLPETQSQSVTQDDSYMQPSEPPTINTSPVEQLDELTISQPNIMCGANVAKLLTHSDKLNRHYENIATPTPTNVHPHCDLPSTTPTNHAQPAIMVLTLIILMAEYLFNTVLPVVSYLYTTTTKHIQSRRRTNRWYTEVQQLFNLA